jgi:RHS repeat-associated protein
VTCTYDLFGNLLTRTDTAGTVVETNVYDLAGRVTTSTGPTFTATVGSSSVSTRIVKNYSYDPWGHQTASYLTSTGDTSGAKADWLTTDYDASGRASQQKKWLWTVAVPAGQVQNTITWRYDSRGKQITAAESTVSGQPALKAYDARGNTVAVWKVGVASYDDSKAQLSTYDAIDRLITSTAEGNVLSTTYTYADDNKTLRTAQPDGSWTENSYDSYGRLSGTTTSRGSTTSVGHDTGNRATYKTDEHNLTTSYSYDCLGRATTAGAAGQTASTTTYNVLNWVLTTTAADAIETVFTYNSAGNVTQEKVAANTTTYTINAAGNVTRVADPQDRRSDMKYDVFGRMIRETQSIAGSPRMNVSDVIVTLDSLGRMVATSDSLLGLSQAVTYPLDTPSSVPDVVTIGSGGSQVQTTILTGADGFEASEQITIASSPQLPSVLRTIDTRDDARRVTSATIDPGNGSLLAARYLYDGAGRPQRQWGTSGGGSGYTAAAETTDAYTYDVSSGLKIGDNLQLASVGTAGPLVSSYSYSSDGRLSEATTNGFTIGYAFNPLGNLVTISPSGNNPTTLAYDAGSRLQTTQVGGVTTTYFSWDTANGRRTSQGPTANTTDPRIRYTYTGTGRLATYVDETRVPQVSAAYTYDAQGQRTKSAVAISGQTTTTQFSYQGLLLMGLSATQTGGAPNDSWRITYLYDENDRPYAGIYRQPDSSAQPVFFGIIATDRGDVVSLLDAAGNPFAAYRYDAWGSPQGAGNLATGVWTQSTGLASQAVADAIATRQPLRYASYCYDSESGLYYLSARHYDPRTAQFLGKDPNKNGEKSPYLYCSGNPVANSDPSGLAARATWHFKGMTGDQVNFVGLMLGLLEEVARGDTTAARRVLKLAGYPPEKITTEVIWELINSFKVEKDDAGVGIEVHPAGGITSQDLYARIRGDGSAEMQGSDWTRVHVRSKYWTEQQWADGHLDDKWVQLTSGIALFVFASIYPETWVAGYNALWLTWSMAGIGEGGVTITMKFRFWPPLLQFYVDGECVFKNITERSVIEMDGHPVPIENMIIIAL